MKIFNDLDEIYKLGGIVTKDGIECSVCGKTYKRHTAFDKHFSKQDCFKYTDMFQGTLVEPMMYKLFEEAIHNDAHARFVPTLSKFRKSPLYSTISKFWLFCFRNNMSTSQTLHYFNYLMDESFKKYMSFEGKRQFTSTILNNGSKENALKIYRTECARGLCTEAMSRDFYDKNKELLGEDVNFTLRALERGDITYDVLFGFIDFDEFTDRLSFAEQRQLETFFEKVA